MSDTAPGSWQPDPYGRFAQRYWDGANWTANVIDSAGGQTTDPPVASGGVTATPTAGAGAAPSPVSLVVVAVGVLSVLLSLFVLNWYDFGEDVKDDLRDTNPSTVERELGLSTADVVDGFKLSEVRDLSNHTEDEDVSFPADAYMNWGYIVAVAAAAFIVGAVLRPSLRTPALVVASVFTVWHAWTVYDLSDESIDTQLGAWLGAAGFVIALVAVLLPRPQPAAA